MGPSLYIFTFHDDGLRVEQQHTNRNDDFMIVNINMLNFACLSQLNEFVDSLI